MTGAKPRLHNVWMLPEEIEKARKRLGLSRVAYAARVGISVQALNKIRRGGGVNGDTLALLQELGDLHISKRLIASLKQEPPPTPRKAA